MKHPGVQRIIDVLKNIDDSAESSMGFDMGRWWADRMTTCHPCGTACCIAGWAQSLIENGHFVHPVEALETFCDLKEDGSYDIWELTSPSELNFSKLTLPMAIKVLEIFRDTGEIKWNEVYHSRFIID